MRWASTGAIEVCCEFRGPDDDGSGFVRKLERDELRTGPELAQRSKRTIIVPGYLDCAEGASKAAMAAFEAAIGTDYAVDACVEWRFFITSMRQLDSRCATELPA